MKSCATSILFTKLVFLFKLTFRLEVAVMKLVFKDGCRIGDQQTKEPSRRSFNGMSDPHPVSLNFPYLI